MVCGRNSGRCFLLTICSLQIISTSLRQIFDFMGFMWLPIIANFFNFIFVIFGFFGAYQHKAKYIIIYVVWLIGWGSYNAFVTCFYLNVGLLDNRHDYLNFGTGSASWWEVNGPGCRPVYPFNLTHVDPLRPLRPDTVEGCVLDHIYVEVIHAATQILLAVLGGIVSVYLLAVLTEEEETYKNKMKANSMYSVEYSPNIDDSVDDSIDLNDSIGTVATHTFQYSSSHQPPTTSSTLTPRRVKRHNRNRASARKPQPPTPQSNFANNYSSGGTMQPINTLSGQVCNPRQSGRRTRDRQSGRRRPQYVNPVTQIMDAESSSTDSQHNNNPPVVGVTGRIGHSNPMYVHSRPVSLHSVAGEQEQPERPPSVHSSYSNYHGVRANIAAANALSQPSIANNMSHIPPNMPFSRSAKGLRGSQSSILGGMERRTALTASEIRLPTTNNSGANFNNNSGVATSNISGSGVALNNATTNTGGGLVSSVPNISPSSAYTSSSDRTNNQPNHYHYHPANHNQHGGHHSNQQHGQHNNQHIHHNQHNNQQNQHSHHNQHNIAHNQHNIAHNQQNMQQNLYHNQQNHHHNQQNIAHNHHQHLHTSNHPNFGEQPTNHQHLPLLSIPPTNSSLLSSPPSSPPYSSVYGGVEERLPPYSSNAVQEEELPPPPPPLTTVISDSIRKNLHNNNNTHLLYDDNTNNSNSSISKNRMHNNGNYHMDYISS